MGRELQKRKNRSSRPKVRVPNNRKKALNPMGNSIIAKNWDKKQTLTQNYRRLGIAARLQAPTGGIELSVADAAAGLAPRQPTKNPSCAEASLSAAIVTEARVERDSSGRIIRVITSTPQHPLAAAHQPLNDPLAAFDSDNEEAEEERKKEEEDKWEDWQGISGDEEDNEVVKQLVRASRLPVAKHTRYQSQEESEWLGRLVAKHGDDVKAMAWDRKLNPYQQTAGDISKRLKRWRKAQKEETGDIN